jgi:cyanate permease
MVDGMPLDARTQLDEIKGLAQYWSTISGALTPVLAVLPVAGFALESLVCPGIEKLQPAVASVFSLLAIAFLYYAFRKANEKSIKLAAISLFCVGCLIAITYFILLFSLVEEVDGRRHLQGFTLTERAREALANNEITSTSAKALLDYFGHDSEHDVWAYRGLAKILIFLTFSVMFALFAGSFFLFTLQSFVHDRSLSPQGKGN